MTDKRLTVLRRECEAIMEKSSNVTTWPGGACEIPYSRFPAPFSLL